MIEKLDSDIKRAVVNIQGMLSDEIHHIFTDKSFCEKDRTKFKILRSKLNHIKLNEKRKRDGNEWNDFEWRLIVSFLSF